MGVSTPPEPQSPDRHTNNDRADRTDYVGPEKWVPEAIAQQEEHIKRNTSCQGALGRPHSYRTFGVPSLDGTIAGSATYQACIVCGVTETEADYRARLAALDRGENS